MIGTDVSLINELTTEVEKKRRNDKAECLHNAFGFAIIGSQKCGCISHIFLEAWNLKQQVFLRRLCYFPHSAGLKGYTGKQSYCKQHCNTEISVSCLKSASLSLHCTAY